MAPSGTKTRSWVVVLNNPEQHGHLDYCLRYDEVMMKYMICGKEKGEKGTPHIQGYVYFHNAVRFATLKKKWPHAHFEAARGTPEENRAYCSKDDFHEHGVLPAKGQRSDLLSLKRDVDEGKNLNAIREAHYSSYLRYQKAIVADIEARREPRSTPTEFIIYWGNTGTGKSYAAHEQFPNAYWKDRGKWWDGYDGHEVVIIDEFYGWLPFSFLLRLGDRYPMQVQVKGGTRKFVAKTVIFTANRPYREWYHHTDERLWAAFERRITKCVEFKALVPSSTVSGRQGSIVNTDQEGNVQATTCAYQEATVEWRDDPEQEDEDRGRDGEGI